MLRRDALSKLQKRLGKNFNYHENKHWRTAEQRAEALARGHALNDEYDKVGAELGRLRDELLADPVYRALSVRLKAIRKDKDEAFSESQAKRFTVGTVSDLGAFSAFHVQASGDSWEEIFRVLDEKAERKEAVTA